MHHRQNILASIVMSALALGAAPALAAAAEGPGAGKERPGADSAETARAVQAALQRDLGLSPDQAKRQQGLQKKAIELDETLQASLGAAYAGSSYEATTGKLVVMVSDARKADEARAAGADARVVRHSKAKLDAIKTELDEAAGKAKGSSAADRRPSGQRQADVAGMTSWYVDTARNVVHVITKAGQADDAAKKLAKYGDAVTIEESDLAPTQADNYMDGGDMINNSTCSAGFNLRNPSTGKGYLVTAGHCVSAGSTLYGHEYTWYGAAIAFGPVLESWFPGLDDAIARNDTGSYVQGPWVDTNPTHGGFITTRSYTDAPVGTTICKSGITTRWTCGKITVKDETVTYDGTKTMYGLTRHSACVEKGDSGGANVSVTSTYAAEGLSSGASMRWDGSRWRCLSTVGQTNVSWYFPMADSMAYYGPKYGITTW